MTRILVTGANGLVDRDLKGAAYGLCRDARLAGRDRPPKGIEGMDRQWTSPIRQNYNSSVSGYEKASVTELLRRTIAVMEND